MVGASFFFLTFLCLKANLFSLWSCIRGSEVGTAEDTEWRSWCSWTEFFGLPFWGSLDTSWMSIFCSYLWTSHLKARKYRHENVVNFILQWYFDTQKVYTYLILWWIRFSITKCSRTDWKILWLHAGHEEKQLQDYYSRRDWYCSFWTVSSKSSHYS